MVNPVSKSALLKESVPDRDWEKLNPCFARIVEQLILQARAAGLDVHLFEGYRSRERQQWLYGRGRNRAGGIVTRADGVERQSWHQVGLAADLCFRDKSGRWVPPNRTPVARWEQLAKIARESGLVCGNDWKMRDRAHFEAPYFADLTPDQLAACRD